MGTNSGNNYSTNNNYVQEDGRLKEIIFMERLTRNNWERNWGFMKDFGKMFKEELARRGLKLEAPRSRGWITRRHVPEPTPSPPFPVTSSGMIGWRASKSDCNLETFGPLYSSPKLTMEPPPEPEEERYPFGQLTIFIG